MTSAEIQNLVAAGESLTLEFKGEERAPLLSMWRPLEKLRLSYASACVMGKPKRLPAALAIYPFEGQSLSMRQSMRLNAGAGHFTLQPLTFSPL